MIVETHAFKTAFVNGEVSGFVLRAELPQPPVRFIFAEVYGTPDCYHIFETRAAADFQLALAATGTPPLDGLSVQAVRVTDIRDYQTLAGRKTVFLVNRAGETTQSLRVGDMPLAARTPPPFPSSLRPTVVPAPAVAPAAFPAEPAPPRVRRRPRLDRSDLASDQVPAPTPVETPPMRTNRTPGLWGIVRRWFASRD